MVVWFDYFNILANFYICEFNHSICWQGWRLPVSGFCGPQFPMYPVIRRAFKLPPVNSIDFSQKWHWFLPIWNGRGVHKITVITITVLAACRIPQKDLRGHESVIVKNGARGASCKKRPMKCTKNTAFTKSPVCKFKSADRLKTDVWRKKKSSLTIVPIKSPALKFYS